MDEFIYRFTDFEYPGRNENKSVSYCESIKKRKVCMILNCQERKPQLQFLLMKVSHSVKFSPVLKVKIEPSYDYGLVCY